MGVQPDLIVLEPDGGHLALCRDGEDHLTVVRRVLNESLGTQNMGPLRAYFADEFGSLPPNAVADRVLRSIGYDHPTGWKGTVLLSMEETPDGAIPPLPPEVVEAVERLMGVSLQVR